MDEFLENSTMKEMLNAGNFSKYSVALNLDVEMVTKFVYFC